MLIGCKLTKSLLCHRLQRGFFAIDYSADLKFITKKIATEIEQCPSEKS